MKTILILGAGLSSSSLIRYLLNHSDAFKWKIHVVDQNLETAQAKIGNHPNGSALSFNALSQNERRPEIEKSDLVISMLPARFHVEVALDCIELKTNLITPSYISPEMKALDQKAKDAGIIIMNEIGVDPGIDHMSAMKIIHAIKERDGKIQSFKSYTGGLIAPDSDTNPWNYKFTWNPRNVVLAGQGNAASFIRNGEYKYIPYNQLFKRLEKISIKGYGDFTGYANRDSLSYRKTYTLEDIPTILRGTLRRPGFCEAWNIFVELGTTHDNYKMTDSESLTPRSFINAFLPYDPSMTVEEKFKTFLGKDRLHLFDKFVWLGLFSKDNVVGKKDASPAEILQEILVSKLSLEEGDKDMLVMVHEFIYVMNGKLHKTTSSMVNLGEDQVFTSMSNTVGLPVAICAKMILNGKLPYKGVTLPIQKDVYSPILDELENYNIHFEEREEAL